VADQGRHRLRYSLVPDADIADAVREGYALNLPVREVSGSVDRVEALVTVDDEGVVVESVKLADDQSGDVVVRLYEARGGRTRARVAASFDHGGVRAVDLLERPRDEAGVSAADEAVTLDLRPFQIVTLRYAR
jgi:alpha-mannosidase